MSKELSKLREERDMYKARAEVYKQLDDVNKALIAVIVKRSGADRDNPLRISMDDVLNCRLEAKASVDEKTREYLIYSAER